MNVAKFYCLSYYYAKNYQNWWKFDKVMTKTILTVFWDMVYFQQTFVQPLGDLMESLGPFVYTTARPYTHCVEKKPTNASALVLPNNHFWIFLLAQSWINMQQANGAFFLQGRAETLNIHVQQYFCIDWKSRKHCRLADGSDPTQFCHKRTPPFYEPIKQNPFPICRQFCTSSKKRQN